jgi:hypothetical protein
METMTETGTEKRVDELSKRVDFGFEQIDRRFEQVDKNFERVDADIRELRADMKADSPPRSPLFPERKRSDIAGKARDAICPDWHHRPSP